LTEGLVKKLPHPWFSDSVVKNFKMFMNRDIFQPINVSNNEGVKTCQLPGMLLEFIMHRSMSEGFITIFCDKDEMLLLPDQDDPVVSLSNVIAPLLQISYSLRPII
jgi:hypothetical protein